MTTARQIITDALYKINVLGTGQSLSAEDANRGFRTLNQMLSTWSVEGNMVFIDTKETFNLTGAASYTIGSGADFDTTRPTDIVTAYTTSGTTDYQLERYDVRQYAAIDYKNTGSIPEIFYYDGNYPIATLFLYPKPSSVSAITLYSKKALTQFASLDTTLTLPPEYETALVYNLAIWLSGDFEREPRAQVVKIANSSKMTVERQNLRNTSVSVASLEVPSSEDGTYSGYNIYRGY
jgi:hypothetical protein